ncbi:lysophospholipid acyltransferase family protein [Verrucomicrobiota bacterium sgz303538]
MSDLLSIEHGERRRLRRFAGQQAAQLQAVSPLVIHWFARYSRRYLRKHFHALRLSLLDVPADDPGRPLVIYLNHASWWDPLVILLLTKELFPKRTFFAPMDARALERYGLFKRIGCFGVEQGTLRGAKQFLAGSLAVLAFPGGALCLTPQGRFADVRERPLRFEGGLGQLASRAMDAVFLPLALEYVYWEERLPEVLTRFGKPLVLPQNTSRNPAEATRLLEEQLMKTQDALAQDSLARSVSGFTNLLSGSSGVGGIYDSWRKLRSWMRGERFVAEHSSL